MNSFEQPSINGEKQPEQENPGGGFTYKELVERQLEDEERGSGRRDLKAALREFTPPEMTPGYREQELKDRNKFAGVEYNIGDQVLYHGRNWYVDSITPKALNPDNFSQIAEDYKHSSAKGAGSMTLVKKPTAAERDSEGDSGFEAGSGLVGDRLYATVSENADVVQKITPELLAQMDKMEKELPPELTALDIIERSTPVGEAHYRLKAEINNIYGEKEEDVAIKPEESPTTPKVMDKLPEDQPPKKA